jgi:hypothetical protein
MRKKLGILGAITLVISSTSTLVSCGNINQKDQYHDLEQVINVTDLGFINYDLKTSSKEDLKKAVLKAINEKNPGINLQLTDLDFELVYKNDTGDF